MGQRDKQLRTIRDGWSGRCEMAEHVLEQGHDGCRM